MRTIYRDCVVGLIQSKDGKILMGMKDPKGGGVYADCWHLPGGGIDESEGQLDALRREMAEEVGVDIANATRVELVDDTGRGESQKTLRDTGEVVLCKMKFYVYRIQFAEAAEDVKVRPGDDIVQLKWVGTKELQNLKLTPPSVALFVRLGLDASRNIHNPDQEFMGTKGLVFIGEKILIYRRDAKANRYPLQLDVPGGAREGQETPFEVFRREVHEEFGLDIEPKDIVYERFYQSAVDQNQRGYYLVAKIDAAREIDIRLGGEGIEFYLMPLEEFLSKKDVWPTYQQRARDYAAAVSLI